MTSNEMMLKCYNVEIKLNYAQKKQLIKPFQNIKNKNFLTSLNRT